MGLRRAQKIGLPANSGCRTGAERSREIGFLHRFQPMDPLLTPERDDPTLRTLGRIAALCSAAGPVEARAERILRELRPVVAYDAAILCAVDPLSGERRPAAVDGLSAEATAHVRTDAFEAEVVQRHARRHGGWPVRMHDVPEALRPPGYADGLLSAFVAADGRYLGFLLIALADQRELPDAAWAVVGHGAPLLATLLDPVQPAAGLAAMLAPHETAIALLPGGATVPLQGPALDEREAHASVVRTARALLEQRRHSGAFLWPRAAGGWFSCRVFCCRETVALLAIAERHDLYCLTRRELEVLRHLVDGQSNAEIAGELWVTTRTVRAHVERILEKLEVSSRAGAVARAIDEGLLLAA
jgi:DNA-binding CsgD family transcriptional regulator